VSIGVLFCRAIGLLSFSWETRNERRKQKGGDEVAVATTNKPELGSELARRNRPERRLCQWMTKRRQSWRGGGTLLRAEGASISSGEEVARIWI